MSEPRTLLIEGWRFIPHSYAIVNQFQCLELLRRPEVRLLHRDVPYLRDNWRATSGILDPQAEASLRAIPPPGEKDQIDAIYRISYPYNLSPGTAARTCVFSTAECGHVSRQSIVGGRPLMEAHADSNNIIITPSRWSREGVIRSGADPKRVIVIPHGINPEIFHPLLEEQRQAQRRRLNWDGFVFLSVGGMTDIKGISLLLKAFAAVVSRHPQARLVLKGLDALYGSRQLVEAHVNGLTPAEAVLIQQKVHYLGGIMPFRDMALLFQMSDAYVAPYFAEGFAMPVLEAAACGCPVLCTAGGSTDDFTNPDFALRIESHVESRTLEDGNIESMTVPSGNSLVQQMFKVIEQPDYANRARMAGPIFVNKDFTWKSVVDRLLPVLFPE